ncbi:DeoR/GlpR family DNA-binding transcription regulator [Faecalicoccus acidiformans]|uniref:DeoR/GlpR family DNA-binding transcription regulator n=1 Tax=Faecalicoccus acidiformans TaxID=915173 RepID=UPI0032085801
MEVMEQRRNDIVRFVNDQGSVTFAQIKERFPKVSDMTLRTDLKVLDANQRLVRIHGGAKSLETVTGNDDFLKKRYIQNTDEKMYIARKALELVEAHKTIFIDSGSTTTMLSNILKDQPNTFFTSGITCAVEMAHLKEAQCFLAGGMINRNSLSVTGMDAVRFLENVSFDLTFLGVTRYSERTGFTCESFLDAQLKRAVVQRSKKIIVLMDSSKVQKDGTYRICDLKDVDIVVSDQNLPETFKKECENQGVLIL